MLETYTALTAVLVRVRGRIPAELHGGDFVEYIARLIIHPLFCCCHDSRAECTGKPWRRAVRGSLRIRALSSTVIPRVERKSLPTFCFFLQTKARALVRGQPRATF